MSRTHAHLVRPEAPLEPMAAMVLELMDVGGPSYYCGVRARPGDPAPGGATPCARCHTLRAMAKKRGRGRPKELTGKVTPLSIRLGQDQMRELRAIARERELTVAGAMRWLVDESAARRRERSG